jgi:LAO/AO transport system kinase
VILKVSSKTEKGISEFITELKKLMTKRKKEKKLSEKQRLAKELDDIILNNINQKVATMLHSSKSYSGYLKKLQDRKIDPFEAADKISGSIIK